MSDDGQAPGAALWADRLKVPPDRREGLEAEIAILLAQIDRLWASAERRADDPGTPLDAL